MNIYDLLAPYYDALMDHYDYEAWADCFEQACGARRPRTVLELGCGTGRLTAAMAARGYEMVAVDASDGMLAVASARETPAGCVKPLYLSQRMEALDLFGTVEAALCCLDGLNHLPDEGALRETLRRLHLFLEPGGFFLFDLLTPAHFAAVDGHTFSSECRNAYVSWRCRCHEDYCHYDFTVFMREKAHIWRRYTAVSREMSIAWETMQLLLYEAGFASVTTHGNENARRVHILARKE